MGGEFPEEMVVLCVIKHEDLSTGHIATDAAKGYREAIAEHLRMV